MSSDGSPIFKMDLDLPNSPKGYSIFVRGLMEKSARIKYVNEQTKKRLFVEYHKKYSFDIFNACEYRAGLGMRDAFINFQRQDFERGLGKPTDLCKEFLDNIRELRGMKTVEVWGNKAFTVRFSW
jgi:hypothetical protein